MNAVSFTLPLPSPKAFNWSIVLTLYLDSTWPLLNGEFWGGCKADRKNTMSIAARHGQWPQMSE
jgi:hypothetical protein